MELIVSAYGPCFIVRVSVTELSRHKFYEPYQNIKGVVAVPHFTRTVCFVFREKAIFVMFGVIQNIKHCINIKILY